MKKIFTLLLAIACLVTVTFAQTKKDDKSKGKEPVKKEAAKTTMAKSDDAKHLKKDGTPDKRFKENKEEKQEHKHLKKDGTPDMRYKENKGEGKKKS